MGAPDLRRGLPLQCTPSPEFVDSLEHLLKTRFDIFDGHKRQLIGLGAVLAVLPLVLPVEARAARRAMQHEHVVRL